ncbi:MAG: 50S ribosomal protein L11 methyltransferase [Candidatus Thermoplasmatota archaeon]|nr:50S ribosomal protein L11 methyltransferase [Candidatus Thermoplasmatota archaeon]
MDISFAFFEKIAFKFEIISSIYLDIYEEMVEKELSMIKTSKEHLILVVGSGTLSATPILIARKTNAKITAIDTDEKAVKESIKYIKSLNLEDRINIIQGDGVDYCLKDFDIIFVLYGIRKQKEMIDNLSKNIKKSTEVIFRTVLKDGKAKIDDKYLDLSKYFLIKKNVQSQCFGIVDSLLLKKKQ